MNPLSAAIVAVLVIGSYGASVGAAEGLAGAQVRSAAAVVEGPSRASALQRSEVEKAQREQWCAKNPDRCREIMARREQRRAQCQADPERCRQEMQAMRVERFQRADADGNGAISRAEAQKAMPSLARRHFDAVDSNRDGQITPEEIEAARKARGANRGRQPG